MSGRRSALLLTMIGAGCLTWGVMGFVAAHWGTVWVGHYDNGVSYGVITRSLATIGAVSLVGGLLLRSDSN